MEQKKIDDLMEVWRQWAARRGIGEAAGEGSEITHDDTHPLGLCLTNEQGQKERQTGLHSHAHSLPSLCTLRNLRLCHSANDI